MPSFGRRSRQERDSCATDLQAVLDDAIKYVNFSVIHGHRNEEAQNEAFSRGRSRNRWPTSRHNSVPSEAFDIVPYPGGYEASYERFYELATYIYASATRKGVSLEWGGHWKNYTGKGDNDRDWAHWQRKK